MPTRLPEANLSHRRLVRARRRPPPNSGQARTYLRSWRAGPGPVPQGRGPDIGCDLSRVEWHEVRNAGQRGAPAHILPHKGDYVQLHGPTWRVERTLPPPDYRGRQRQTYHRPPLQPPLRPRAPAMAASNGDRSAAQPPTDPARHVTPVPTPRGKGRGCLRSCPQGPQGQAAAATARRSWAAGEVSPPALSAPADSVRLPSQPAYRAARTSPNPRRPAPGSSRSLHAGR